MDRLLVLPLASLLALIAVMAWAWRRQRQSGNAGVVDVIWSGSLGAMAVLYALASEGWWPRRLLVAALAGVWSARLTVHLYRRVVGEAEDGRYAALRSSWGQRFDAWIFWFFQAQAVLAVLLSLVFLQLTAADLVGWRAVDAVALALWIVSLSGEALADRQLRRWRARPENRGRTCREGLWRFSRHPNYFFEWLHWLAYPVLGIGLPYGWLLWLAPAGMLYLVLFVTGVPPTEQQALRSRGDDYRDYQRTTNAFFPGLPRPRSNAVQNP